MQTFYTQLLQALEVFDPDLDGLAKLTQADLSQVLVLKSDLEWVFWPAGLA